MRGILSIKNTNYTNLTVDIDGRKESVSVDTKLHHVFHGDIVNVENGVITDIYHKKSIYRTSLLAGILDITSIRKYGFNKRGTPIYYWKPFNKEIPPFYVSSNIRKKMKEPYSNVYCIIRYNEWTRDRPSGNCVRILGSVHDDSATILYLQYCYNLYKKIYNIPRGVLIEDNHRLIEGLPICEEIIFSIDPKGTRDIDDALSISEITPNNFKIGIYIADPGHIIDYMEGLGCDGLYNSICEKGLTLYTSMGNFPMMPEIVSTNLASLLPHKKRPSLSIHFNIDKRGNVISDITFEHSVIQNTRAYTYEEVDRIVEKGKVNKGVYKLYKLSQVIANTHTPKLYDTEWNSHKMVEALMVFANKSVARILYDRIPDKVITRSHSGFNRNISNVPKHLSKRVEIMNTTAAKYTRVQGYHHGLGISFYTHFTSPIRRIVDLYTHYLIKELFFRCKMPSRIGEIAHDLDNVNNRVRMSKRYHYALNKLNLYKNISELSHGYDDVLGYIVDMEDNVISIYVEKYDMVFRHHIIHRDMTKLYIFALDYDHKGNIFRQRIHRETGEGDEIIYTLYESYPMRLFAVNADCLRDRIRVELIRD